MLKSLEYINYLLNCNGNLDYTLNGKKIFYISEDILELFKEDLMILDSLLPYLFEVDSDDGEPLIGMYDLMINRDLSITDRLDIKIWLKSKEVGDNHD